MFCKNNEKAIEIYKKIIFLPKMTSRATLAGAQILVKNALFCVFLVKIMENIEHVLKMHILTQNCFSSDPCRGTNPSQKCTFLRFCCENNEKSRKSVKNAYFDPKFLLGSWAHGPMGSLAHGPYGPKICQNGPMGPMGRVGLAGRRRC